MKRSQIFALITAVFLASAAVSAALRPQQAQPSQTEAAQSESAPYAYLLRCETRRAQEQTLVLFCLSQGAWEKVADFPVTLDDLPETDRLWLQTGIALRDAGELQRTLEDYLPMR